jgi:Protein of unknown function (DUF2934)
MFIEARGAVLDHNTRRKKQLALMTELIERKIRLHAQHLYEQRGQAEGMAEQDWVEAESQVLENSIMAPLYRRTRATGSLAEASEPAEAEFATAEASSN